MSDRLRHRGPDDAGTYRDDRATLGFRRLSIVDLEGGHQPLSNEDGSVWVAFNGEIYNFPALRNRLEARGHTLRSAGDTEVLVHLYEDEGPGFVEHLRGMFALAIWDTSRRRLVLARDRLGQKPLLYRVEPGRIVFASELKALLALPASIVPRALDPRGLDQYLTYGYVPHPSTILEAVRKLPPAHYAIWHDGEFSLHHYWSPDWSATLGLSPGEDVERLRALLTEAVREQMVSDVPLGAFLSGGIDSTIIVGLMQRASDRPVKTFAIGFDDPAFDERSFAATAAAHLGTEHRSFVVEPDAWSAVPALAEQFDEPFADSSALPTWFVARETRRHVTVALTGDAGDELFAGYDRYRAVALTARAEALPPGVRRWIAGPLARGLPVSTRAKTPLRKVRRLLESLADPPESRYRRWMTLFDEPSRLAMYSDDALERLAEADARDADHADPGLVLIDALGLARGRDPVTRAQVADLMTYLPGDLLFKVDMASMAHGLECRGPFLDHRVVEMALGLPVGRKIQPSAGRSKIVLKETFSELLPRSLQHRPKMGFGVPIDRWFRGPLRDHLRDSLLDPRSRIAALIRGNVLERLIDEHVTGVRDHAYKLWALLMLELWFRNHDVD
jgi:asparagine synthase (glutamine-hydrolysing)